MVPNSAHFDDAPISSIAARRRNLDPGEGSPQPPPFKGNLDVAESMRSSNGWAATGSRSYDHDHEQQRGQPVSLENIRATRRICDKYRLPLFLDACRFAENAWFIKTREPGQEKRSVREIVREMFDLADGATISAKKDGLVNIGGVLMIRDADLFRRAANLLILTEGYVTYGGLSGRDLEAMAQGFVEVVEEDYLAYRIRSTSTWVKLIAAGVPILEPPGGHAIYLDAKVFCPHAPIEQFPGQAIVCGLYRAGGIRAVEIGSVMFGGAGRPPPAMELVRLTIPRRVYTQSHIDYVIEVVVALHQRRRELRGLRITEEAPALRHFTAKFEELL